MFWNVFHILVAIFSVHSYTQYNAVRVHTVCFVSLNAYAKS